MRYRVFILIISFVTLTYSSSLFSQSILAGDSTSLGVGYRRINDSIIKPPGFTTGTFTKDIDLDGDNTKDIRINWVGTYHISPPPTYSSLSLFLSALNGTELNGRVTNIIDTVPLNSVIDQSLFWTTNDQSVAYYYNGPTQTYNCYVNPKGNYVAFRRKTANDTLYGWVFIKEVIYLPSFSDGNIIIEYAGFRSKTVGINENELFSKNINVYPQPAKDLVIISLNYFYDKKIEMKITDITGKEIEKKELLVEHGKTQFSIDHLSDGIYLLQINSGNQTTVKRLMVTR